MNPLHVLIQEELGLPQSHFFYSPAEFIQTFLPGPQFSPQTGVEAKVLELDPETIFFLNPGAASFKIIEALFHLYQGQLPRLVFVVDESFYYEAHQWAQIAGCLRFQEILFLLPHPHARQAMEKFFRPHEGLCHILPWALRAPLPKRRQIASSRVAHCWGAWCEGKDWEQIFSQSHSQELELNISGPLELPRFFSWGETQLLGLSFFEMNRFLQKNPRAKYLGDLSEEDFFYQLIQSASYIDYSKYPYPHPPLGMLPYFLGLDCQVSSWGFYQFFESQLTPAQRQAPFLPAQVLGDLEARLHSPFPKLDHMTELFLRLCEAGPKTPTRLWQESQEYWAYGHPYFELYPC